MQQLYLVFYLLSKQIPLQKARQQPGKHALKITAI